jgi:hypothetical protein
MQLYNLNIAVPGDKRWYVSIIFAVELSLCSRRKDSRVRRTTDTSQLTK